MKRVTLNDKKKVNIQRDYSTGIGIKFKSDYPADIRQLIDEDTWVSFISELNYRYDEAEKVSAGTICETLLGCFTCYLSRLCYVPSGYAKMDKIGDFIIDVNDRIMIPRGLYVANPIERGFRAMEVTLIYEKMEIKQQPEIYQNLPKNQLLPR